MPANNNELEKKLWEAADELRANSKLRSSEYSTPVLGLVFLKWTDHKFTQMQKRLEMSKDASRRRAIGKVDYQAQGVLYVPEKARFSHLMKLPEGSDAGKAINDAMKAIEDENEDLRGVLPMSYNRFENSLLFSLLRIFNSIPTDIEGDVFGRVYEYFLGKFAMSEGQKGGEFFTPVSLVRLIVEILEPFHGRIYDPACGSGGMFVQSAHFVERHQKNPRDHISIYGQEKTSSTVQLCKMNLAVHGLAGDIKEGNTYYQDIHQSRGKFDFVMANPPFNVDKVDKEKLKDDPRLPFGIPHADNANYLWIQIFYSAMNARGRAGFVMANSACDTGGSEMDIRRKLIQEGAVDVVVSVASKFFYTVALPCTLWFFDRNKAETGRQNKVLFIDARHVFLQVDRAHRQFTPAQIEYLANVVSMYRGEQPTTDYVLNVPSSELQPLPYWSQAFPDGRFRDVPGFCRAASIEEIEVNGWSLNPGRYVGIPDSEEDQSDFAEKLGGLHQDFGQLTREAEELVKHVTSSVESILDEEFRETS